MYRKRCFGETELHTKEEYQNILDRSSSYRSIEHHPVDKITGTKVNDKLRRREFSGINDILSSRIIIRDLFMKLEIRNEKTESTLNEISVLESPIATSFILKFFKIDNSFLKPMSRQVIYYSFFQTLYKSGILILIPVTQFLCILKSLVNSLIITPLLCSKSWIALLIDRAIRSLTLFWCPQMYSLLYRTKLDVEYFRFICTRIFASFLSKQVE